MAERMHTSPGSSPRFSSISLTHCCFRKLFAPYEPIPVIKQGGAEIRPGIFRLGDSGGKSWHRACSDEHEQLESKASRCPGTLRLCISRTRCTIVHSGKEPEPAPQRGIFAWCGFRRKRCCTLACRQAGRQFFPRWRQNIFSECRAESCVRPL